ncbi:hypothetical protein BC941DRAFT_446251 [Chlamydoabsidia padenii]|nr:hypothetical protein BC941DRAFT_446251 [Chlamydoabsidia padenii]
MSAADVITMEQEQQLVYRIDCDKHYTPGGAPPILVLQKESVKPPILILQGMQTDPSRAPVIKDERRNKSQGYILQDERKPPLGNNQPYGENSYSAYQQSMMSAPPMNGQQLYGTNQGHPMDQSQDPSSFGVPHQQPSKLPYVSNSSMSNPWFHNGMGQQQQQQQLYSSYINHNSNNNNDDDIYTPTRPSLLDDITYPQQQQEPYHWQTASYPQQDSWGSSFSPYHYHQQQQYPPFFDINYGHNNPYTNRMPTYGGMDSMNMGAEMMPSVGPASSSYNHNYPPSSPWPNYYDYDNRMTMMPAIYPDEGAGSAYLPQWNNNYNGYDAHPSMQPDLAHGRQPAFRVLNGEPRRSKSVSFAPLPDHVAA